MQLSWFFSQLSRRQQKLISQLFAPFESIMAFLDYFYPKSSGIILFGSDAGEFASGSPKALFNYMQKNHSEYKALFYAPFMQQGFLAKMKYVIGFAPLFFKARFLVSSHPPKDFFPFSWSTKKFFINAWHGIPLKAMFFSDRGETKDSLRGILKLNKKTSAFLAASPMEAKLIARCFCIESSKFWYLGHPRNDFLKKGDRANVLRKSLQSTVDYDKVLLYCPTFRRDAPTLFFPFDDLDLAYLNEFLEKNKAVILIRDHIYSKTTRRNFYSQRIVPFGFDVCDDVNSVLPEVDVLITDYSSIFVDYLLLNRPCIFVPYDLENYSRKRGLLLDYNSWAAGRIVSNFQEFMAAIEEALCGVDAYDAMRRELRDQFHQNQTKESCAKVVHMISYCRMKKD